MSVLLHSCWVLRRAEGKRLWVGCQETLFKQEDTVWCVCVHVFG